jgi:maleylpyruvate isomerase
VSDLTIARAELRRRLGVGARFDDPASPAEVLSWVRTGTAYFARLLNDLQDADLSAPAGESDYSRAYVVAEISYQARSLAELTMWARTGVSKPETNPFARISEDAAFAVTLTAGALRNLFLHSEVHLNVEWLDLRTSDWDALLELPDGRQLTARQATWIRARSIWLKAVDLDNGGSFLDFPPNFIDALLTEAAAHWGDADAVALELSDRAAPLRLGSGPSVTSISGRAADLARWVTGFGAKRLVAPSGLPDLPTCSAPWQPTAT